MGVIVIKKKKKNNAKVENNPAEEKAKPGGYDLDAIWFDDPLPKPSDPSLELNRSGQSGVDSTDIDRDQISASDEGMAERRE